MTTVDPLAGFGPSVQSWFRAAFPAPTPVQALAFPTLASEERPHALLLAPTGTGKTLAAFLAALDRLVRRPPDGPPGVRVLYVSPLKALVADIERNLRAPLVGIQNAALRTGTAHAPVRVDLRTGDTSARDRRLQAREPGEVLVTTPESLYLLLGSSARETLRTVDTVILDEIHAVAGTKRGVHLALSLERLSRSCDREPQRVGLSATQRPLEEIAAFLGGDRPVEILDASRRPDLDLRIVVPVEDMDAALSPAPTAGGGEGMFQRVGPSTSEAKGPERLTGGMWPAIYPRLLELVRQHRSTLIFVNSRLLCERLAQRLNELAGEELVRAHHGSLSHEQRARIEEDLKAGRIPGLVATSSLELGIDMGAIDLVVLVESPGSVSSGLQRVGRAGHQVGVRSIGRLFPKYRGDLVEAAVVAARMLDAAVEPTRVPRNCLDVLAQQIVAMVCDERRPVEELYRLVRRAYPYRDLPRSSFVAVLDMLSGRYPTDEFADLAPRLVWDRSEDVLTERKGSRLVATLNGGTIPDRGLYGVFMAGEGRRIGELDEEMVYESRRGDLVILGASTWRVEEITRDKVVVSPAPGEPGRLPFWHGDRPRRTVEVGAAVGALLREVDTRGEGAADWLATRYPLDAFACRNLVAYVREQRLAAGAVPSDRTVVVESFRDELGDWRVCVLTPFGARVHAPWALLLEQLLAPSFDVRVLWGDDGLSLRFADVEELPPASELFPDPDGIEDRIVEQLQKSALFSARFRENAARSLLLPKRTRQGRQPLWAMRLRAQNLQGVALRYPAFPVVLETFRECLQDVLDLGALKELLGRIRSREVRVHEVETPRPSPFARSLVFAWVAAYMYEGDTPLAERRAMALSVDRTLLAELLGDDELRDLLDPAVIAAVEAELQHRDPERHVRHADALHDLLRRVGDHTLAELRERCAEDPGPWLAALVSAKRAIQVRIAGEDRFLAIEDAGRVRDALGVSLPGGLPSVFTEPVPDALDGIVARFARTRGPFATESLAHRYALPVAVARLALATLHQRGKLTRGAPGDAEWCDPEVLRQLKRRTLAALRHEIAAVEAPVYASFLAGWHGVGSDRQGVGRLREVVAQLEGLPIQASLLEEEVLPARIAGFSSDLLDLLGATGEVVWVGCGALGPRDGKVALLRRDRVSLLLDPPAPSPLTEEPLPARILAHLGQRGACFLFELLQLDPDGPAVTEALWALAFGGYVTNDTFQPLRALRARKTGRGRPNVAAGGRWSTVASLFVGPPRAATERHAARAVALLERYGVASAEAARHEELPGGFTTPYEVLRVMEETGKVRRGRFVEGLQGAQFAAPGVVDRLRGHRVDDGAVTVLAAADPASPWGALLDWPRPELVPDAPRPRRVGGAKVIAVGGRPVLYVEKGERSLLVLDADEDRLAAALSALVGQGTDRWRTVRVERIDGAPAADHPLRDALVAAGFARTALGLEHARRGSAP
jgi:ATP-dependent Lhr-like helicase